MHQIDKGVHFFCVFVPKTTIMVIKQHVGGHAPRVSPKGLASRVLPRTWPHVHVVRVCMCVLCCADGATRGADTGPLVVSITLRCPCCCWYTQPVLYDACMCVYQQQGACMQRVPRMYHTRLSFCVTQYRGSYRTVTMLVQTGRKNVAPKTPVIKSVVTTVRGHNKCCHCGSQGLWCRKGRKNAIAPACDIPQVGLRPQESYTRVSYTPTHTWCVLQHGLVTCTMPLLISMGNQ